MKNMTPEGVALVKLLGDIISEEVGKPDGQTNMELIRECDSLLSDLLDDQLPVTEKHIEQRLASVMEQTKQEKKRRKISIPRLGRRIAVCAAVFVVVGLSTVGGYAYFPSFHDWVNKTFSLPVGESFKTDGVTFINVGEPKVYPDMETLMKQEGLEGILYPKTLPEDLKIVSVEYSGEETEFSSILFRFSDPLIRFSIDLNSTSLEEPLEGDKTETVGNLTFVIKNLKDIRLYHATAFLDGRMYCIEGPSFEQVREVIQGFDGGVK